MSILALDTAMEACSVAVVSPSGRAVRYEELSRGHSERILAMVDAALAEARLSLADLDAVAFGRGPGSFTGVRLAASIAQGLAFGARLPVVPVSDLAALAQRVLDSQAAESVLVCADARMSEVYWACFRRGARGLAEVCEPGERASLPGAVEAAAGLADPVHGAGRGFLAYPELLARFEGRLRAVHGQLLPRAEEVARLALAEIAAGRTVAPEAALPTYLRDDVARPGRERGGSR